MTSAPSFRAWRRLDRLTGTLAFLAPLVALVAIWQAVVTVFQVHPGVFPGVPAVLGAGVEAIRDGSLPVHVGDELRARPRRDGARDRGGVPLGVAMGVSPVVSSLLTPVFRFFSVLAGIAWIPIATLWFGYGFGAITFVIFNAVFFIVAYNTLLGVSTIPHAAAPRGRLARRRPLGDAHGGAAARRAARTSSPASAPASALPGAASSRPR